MIKIMKGKKILMVIVMVMINKNKLTTSPRTLQTNAKSNLLIEQNQTHKKRNHRGVEVGIRVIVISIRV